METVERAEKAHDRIRSAEQEYGVAEKTAKVLKIKAQEADEQAREAHHAAKRGEEAKKAAGKKVSDVQKELSADMVQLMSFKCGEFSRQN